MAAAAIFKRFQFNNSPNNGLEEEGLEELAEKAANEDLAALNELVTRISRLFSEKISLFNNDISKILIVIKPLVRHSQQRLIQNIMWKLEDSNREQFINSVLEWQAFYNKNLDSENQINVFAPIPPTGILSDIPEEPEESDENN